MFFSSMSSSLCISVFLITIAIPKIKSSEFKGLELDTTHPPSIALTWEGYGAVLAPYLSIPLEHNSERQTGQRKAMHKNSRCPYFTHDKFRYILRTTYNEIYHAQKYGQPHPHALTLNNIKNIIYSKLYSAILTVVSLI